MRETALGAYAHQDLPFEQLVEELDPPRDLSRNPVVQVLFQLANVPRAALNAGGLQSERLRQEAELTRFDQEWYLSERGQGLTGRVVYNTDLFDAATVSALASAFERVLAAVASDAGARVSELPVLDQAAARDLARPAGAVPETGLAASAVTVHGLFAERVAERPDAVALADGPRRLTFAGLDAAGARVARALRSAASGRARW